MEKVTLIVKRAVAILILAMLIATVGIVKFDAKANVNEEMPAPLSGKGTAADPYLIESVDDLILFRDSVNSGCSYQGKYILQTKDIDLGEETRWIPIGEFGTANCFYGYYDGGCHRIINLFCEKGNGESSDNMGFFGALYGTVCNLGIESGRIDGAFVGSIASHSGNTGAIINCYNRAEVIGTGRAGGICDNFYGGAVVNCVNFGHVDAPQNAGIVSYDAKCILNVCSSSSVVYGPTFTGIFANYTMPTEADPENLYQLLNVGIEYLATIPEFEGATLRRWEVEK